MKELFSKIMLFGLILLIGSCKKDKLPENTPDSQPKTYSEFVVNNDALDQLNPTYRYLMLTNQKGEILHETLKPEKNAQFSLQVEDGDIIDLTVIATDNRVYTFRNIKSGFRLDAFSSPFFESCYGNINYLNLKINITGISDFDELYFGIQDKIEKQENSISIATSYTYLNDRTITILPKGSSEYLSYVVKIDDLDYSNHELATKEISIEDFKPSNIYQVAVDEKGKYVGYLTMWDENNFSFTNRIKGYQDLEKGDKLNFFVSQEQTDFVKELGVTKVNKDNISSHKYFVDRLPESVSISTSNLSIDGNGQSYSYSSSSDFDLGATSYSFYNPETTISLNWEVFQNGSDNKTYKLPEFKKDILSDKYLSALKSPNIIFLTTYKFSSEMSSIEDVFDMCRDYESVSVRKEF